MRNVAVFLSAVFLTVVFLSSICGAQESVRLRSPSARGEPGEVVAIEFFADLPAPVEHFLIGFRISEDVGEFVGTDVSGTVSAHAEPRSVFSEIDDDADVEVTIFTGASLDRPRGDVPLLPGENLLLVKARFRIHATAAVGDHPIRLVEKFVNFGTPSSQALPVEFEGGLEGTLTVEEPAGPRPVGAFTCGQRGDRLLLGWENTEAYDGIRVSRNGNALATLAGSDTSYTDQPPTGPVSYRITALVAGAESIAVFCDTLMETPRPEPIEDLQCEPSPDGTALSWVNGDAYDGITVLRNGRTVAELPGDARSFLHSSTSDLFTVYSVLGTEGDVETVAANCTLNEFSDVFSFRAAEVRTRPGADHVEIPIHGTNPESVQGFSLSMRIDPEHISLRDVRIEGTRTEEFQPDYFAFFPVEERGEVNVGIVFDFFEDAYYTAAADQIAVRLIVDIHDDAPEGLSVPVEFGSFAEPPTITAYTSVPPAETIPTQTIAGAILIGDSPVPEVENAVAEELAPAHAAKQVAPESGIQLRWTNGGDYDAIRIERDGLPLDEIAGDRTSYLDATAGSGRLHYRIRAVVGGEESFPVAVLALPRGVPGTFLRGDANGDDRVDVSDAVGTALYLFRGGSEPDCLDAADADDDGDLTIGDAVTVLHYLFLGGLDLPAPGPHNAWLDPTADELSCGE